MSRLMLSLVWLYMLLSIFTGCGSSGIGDFGLGGQDFSVSPGSLSFSAQIDGSAPGGQNITVAAKGIAVEEPDVIYTTDIINDCIIEYPTDDTIVLTVTMKLPVMLGLGTHNTSVTIENSDHRRVVPITYTITDLPPGDPIVNYVAPSTIMAGRSHEMIIRGSGFNLFNSNNTPSVIFGGVSGTNIRVVNDTQMIVTTTALLAGRHGVSVAGTTTNFSSSAELLVISPKTYETTEMASYGDKSRIIFDARRDALYIANVTLGQIERYTHQVGTTWAHSTLSLPGVKDMALSPDGEVLIAVTATKIYEINPVSLDLGGPIQVPLRMHNTLASVAMANDGKAIAVGNHQGSGIYGYDLVAQAAFEKTYLNSSFNEVVYWISSPKAHPMPDGSGIYIGETLSTNSELLYYSAADGTVIETGLEKLAFGFFSLHCDREKSIFCINNEELYDNEFNLLASLTQSYSTTVISPDGDMLYAYYRPSNTLRAFDISNPSAPVQVGADASLSSSTGLEPLMDITQDGNTLLIAGRENLHVIDLTSFSF